ncbi:MAG: glycosyltransferase family 2 protein [Muribaculaceae bacterium]|nr:glycosyltransferase family 2 protein [Muribaculaceae bacterium]
MKDTICQNDCMSIVVPVYNRPELVVRCLESIKAQTYRPLHIIVVDNASSDDTADRVSVWMDSNAASDFTVELISESRSGAAYARERGLGKVRTEKVMFFDSDDTMRPECVDTVMDAWMSAPEVEIVAWRVAIHSEDGVRITHAIEGSLLERHLVHAVLRTQGYAVKTEFIRRAGGWKGEFPVWNDLETGVRLLLNQPEVKALPDLYVDVFHQEESITGVRFSDKAGKWEKSLDGIERNIKGSGRKDTSRLLGIISYRRAILAAYYAREGNPELAHPLYRRALSETVKIKRPLIRFAYHWTRLGMRGAFSIIGRFL